MTKSTTSAAGITLPENLTTRRTALRAFAGIAALGVPGAAAPLVAAAPVPLTMAELGKELDRLSAIERRVLAYGSDEEVTHACDATAVVVKDILHRPAISIEDFRVKVKALAWCHNGDYAEEDVFGHGKTTDVLLAKSIIRDLFAV